MEDKVIKTKEKEFDKLTIKDNFIFGAVMRNEKQCKTLLECILGIKIRKIEYTDVEKVIEKTYSSKGVRLDVYVEDDMNTVYNIEMQATNKKNLPKRIRYYQAMIDLNIIEKGSSYNKLKKSFIIFICDYDEFGFGRHIYTFTRTCREVAGLEFGDDTTVIVLNTNGIADDVSDDLKNLLKYIGGQAPRGELARSLDNEVQNVKNSEKWRWEYMTLQMRDRENVELGEMKKQVFLIRKITRDKVAATSDFLGVSESFVIKVMDLIEENPDLDDEEIAEMLVDF